MGPLSALGTVVYFDTMVLIYAVERRAAYEAALAQPLADLWAGRFVALTSEMTWLEALVVPYRHGDTKLVARFEDFLTTAMTSLPIERSVLDLAARLRARLPALRTPDAIHAATALTAGCSSFLTNDARFSQVPDLPVVLVSDLPA